MSEAQENAVVIATKPETLGLRFNPVVEGSDQHKKLMDLVGEGKVAAEDVLDYDVTDGGKKRVQRKAIDFPTQLPDLISVLAPVGYSATQAAVVQGLVDKHIKEFNQKRAAVGEKEFLSGLEVLSIELPTKAKGSSAIKVTKEMVLAATASIVAFVNKGIEAGTYKAGLAPFLEKYCSQKFSLTICNPILAKTGGREVFEQVITVIDAWLESTEVVESEEGPQEFTALEVHGHAATAWLDAIAKVTKAEEEALDDLF